MSEIAADRHCALGYCRAGLAGRGRSLYCSDEHAEAARSRQTVDARGARAAEAAYERISRGEDEPLPHLGWLGTTNGVVLDGEVVVELRALIDEHRAAMADLVNLVKRAEVTPREVKIHLERRVIDVDRRLLTGLRKVLTEQQSPHRGDGRAPR